MKVKDLLKDVENVELTPEQEKQIKDYLGIKETKRWKPNHGERYWYIPHCGDIASTLWSNYCDLDADLFAMGNCFKTETDAEFALERHLVYQELKNFADENNDPIEWTKSNVDNYYIYLHHRDNTLCITDCWNCQDLGQIYFSSCELAEQAIQKVGEDRIKKYLFGVEINNDRL